MKAPITAMQAMNHPDVAMTINALGEMCDNLRAALAECSAKDAEIERLTERNVQMAKYNSQLATKCDTVDTLRTAAQQALEAFQKLQHHDNALLDLSYPGLAPFVMDIINSQAVAISAALESK